MKKISFLFTMFVCVLLLTACKDAEPLIRVEATFSPVNDEQYREIGATKDLNEPKQEDFKIFEFHFDMEHTNSVKKRKIDMYNFENVQQVLNDIDGKARYWYGSWVAKIMKVKISPHTIKSLSFM